MPFRRSPSHAVYSSLELQKLPRNGRLRLVLALALLLAAVLATSLFLRQLSSEIAMSDAQDAVALAINDSVSRVMLEHNYGFDYFVTIQKDFDGNITAITTNTARMNLLATEILGELVRTADSKRLNISIPLGNLLGANTLLGKGPDIPVEIIMLTSSFVSFENDLSATGINQSKHSITLKAEVDIDILIPWATVSTVVETDILIAETVIVGRVPETYVNVTEENHGSK